MKKLKVLQVCYAYPPSFSGYGRQLATINNVFVNEGRSLTVQVITGFDGNRNDAGIRVCALFSRPRSTYSSDRRSFFLFCLWLPLRLMLSLPFADAVHVVKAGPEAMITVVMARLFGKPVMAKVVQEEFDRALTRGGMQRLRRKLVLKANAFIAISNKIRDDLLQAGVSPEKIIQIPNGVDTERFSPVEEKRADALFVEMLGRERQPKEAVFSYIGAINQRKGIEVLLSAIERLSPSFPATFLFAGPDKGEIDDFQERISAINATGGNVRARYLGPLQLPENLLRFTTALILPSYSEGMPNVVLESMACGVPVIASDIPVHREIVSTDMGLIFPTGNAVELSKALDSLVSRNPKMMGEACRNFVSQYFSISSVKQKYVETYRILKNSNRMNILQ